MATPILDKIKKLEAEHINKVYSAEDLTKKNELDIRLEQILHKHALCRIDCELRNRHRVSDEKQQPIDETLRKELEELESDVDDIDDIDGGNKRQSRRRRSRRRRSRRRSHRRSFRNKTNQKHSRRQKRSNRIRSNTRRHRK